MVQTAGDADGVETAVPGDNANDPLEGAGGDGGRFQGMRSRMKQAGKGLMTKKGPSVRRGKETENQASGKTTGKNDEQPGMTGRTSSETMGGRSSGDTLSDTEGEVEQERAGKARGEDNSPSRAAGGENTPKNRGDDSDTARWGRPTVVASSCRDCGRGDKQLCQARR